MAEVATLPFGKHKDKPLTEVPTDYLGWLLREAKLSTGLYAAVVAEMARRGAPLPPPKPPPPAPVCRRCGPSGKIRYAWGEASNGRRFIRAECRACGAWLGTVAQVEPYVALANASASPTALLDVLVQAEEQGVQLATDGHVADFATGGDWSRATPELRASLRQCRHRLGGMLAKTPEPTR